MENTQIKLHFLEASLSQCSQNLMRVRFCKNAGIMRVHFLLKCGYYAGITSQKCGYITKKMRVLCGYFKRCNTFSSLSLYTKLFSFHIIYKLALPCTVKNEVLCFTNIYIISTGCLNVNSSFWNLSATPSNSLKNTNILQTIPI